MDSGGLVLDTNNGFVRLVVTELFEFLFLLVFGIVIAFFLTGSWDLTGVVLVLDICQNFVVWVWLKYLKPLWWVKRRKR